MCRLGAANLIGCAVDERPLHSWPEPGPKAILSVSRREASAQTDVVRAPSAEPATGSRPSARPQDPREHSPADLKRTEPSGGGVWDILRRFLGP